MLVKKIVCSGLFNDSFQLPRLCGLESYDDL